MRAQIVPGMLIAMALLASAPLALHAERRTPDGLTDRADTPGIVCPEANAFEPIMQEAAFAPGFVDCNANSLPDECDIEWGTSLDCNLDLVPDECQVVGCELEDGAHLIALQANDRVTWFPERGFNTFNLYRGDLDLLKTARLYTQDPATVPHAARHCHRPAVSLADGIVPESGEAVYYLLTGTTGSLEGSLDADSSGVLRPNDHPCPPPPALSVSPRTDKAVYAPGEVVQIEVELANAGTTGVIALQFPTTCQTSFRIEDLSGSSIYGNPQSCFLVFTQLILQPGQTAAFAYTWPQIDDAGQPLTLSGEFVVRGVVLDQAPEPSGITGIAIAP